MYNLQLKKTPQKTPNISAKTKCSPKTSQVIVGLFYI